MKGRVPWRECYYDLLAGVVKEATNGPTDQPIALALVVAVVALARNARVGGSW